MRQWIPAACLNTKTSACHNTTVKTHVLAALVDKPYSKFVRLDFKKKNRRRTKKKEKQSHNEFWKVLKVPESFD